jgi:hypothetical protein
MEGWARTRGCCSGGPIPATLTDVATQAHTSCCVAELTSYEVQAPYLGRAGSYASGPARPADAQPVY